MFWEKSQKTNKQKTQSLKDQVSIAWLYRMASFGEQKLGITGNMISSSWWEYNEIYSKEHVELETCQL